MDLGTLGHCASGKTTSCLFLNLYKDKQFLDSEAHILFIFTKVRQGNQEVVLAQGEI